MRRLLVVTAHPDDEAGGFGGTLLLSRERGIETYVICLTPGQAASNRGGAKSDEELSAMRRKEFARSCENLQVTHGEVLNYHDGALDKETFLDVVGELTRKIREIRPQRHGDVRRGGGDHRAILTTAWLPCSRRQHFIGQDGPSALPSS